MVSASRKTIQSFANRLARTHHPRKIILFGSHAYGRPHRDSDVDLLVLFDRCNDVDETAIETGVALSPRFPMDLLVRTSRQVRSRLRQGDSFLSDVLVRGTVLYEAGD